MAWPGPWVVVPEASRGHMWVLLMTAGRVRSRVVLPGGPPQAFRPHPPSSYFYTVMVSGVFEMGIWWT